MFITATFCIPVGIIIGRVVLSESSDLGISTFRIAARKRAVVGIWNGVRSGVGVGINSFRPLQVPVRSIHVE
jgi:hypothetical protein